MANKPRPRRQRRKRYGEQLGDPLIDSRLDIRTLIVADYSYEQLKESQYKGGKKTLADVAASLGMGADTLYHHLQLFEEEFRECGIQGPIFLRRPGRGSTTTVNPQADGLFRHLKKWLEHFRTEVRLGQFYIHLGASLTTATEFLPPVLRVWRQRNPEAPGIILTHGKPRELVEQTRSGSLDLTLTGGEKDWSDEGFERPHCLELPFYLLCPAGHDLATGWPASWDRVDARYTAVLLDPRKRPTPAYPMDELRRRSVRIMLVESYEEMLAQILAGGDVFCFAAPQGLRDETRRHLAALPVRDRFPTMGSHRLCLLRSVKAKEGRTPERNDIIDDLHDHIRKSLIDLGRTFADEAMTEASGLWKVCHVTRIGDCRQAATWYHSEVSCRVMQDGFLSGIHRVPLPHAATETALLRISGRLCRHKGEKGDVYKFFWTGTTHDGKSPSERGQDEEYAARLVADAGDLATGPFVGTWMGRLTWTTERDDYFPGGGYMVLTRRTARNAKSLIDSVERFEQLYGQHALDKPGTIR